jgi:hypothetical protein
VPWKLSPFQATRGHGEFLSTMRFLASPPQQGYGNDSLKADEIRRKRGRIDD